MRLYRTKDGIIIDNGENVYEYKGVDWDILINEDELYLNCQSYCREENIISDEESWINKAIKPINKQEVWASGVTYYNSKLARQEEAQAAGGGDFYARVYIADRPELFYKSSGFRCVGSGEQVGIRSDSSWNVPEPELTLCITRNQKIVGFTIGNDMSSRSIEGENPLYLPQAKTYNRSASLGPCVYVAKNPYEFEDEVYLKITRNGEIVFQDAVHTSQMVRKFEDLSSYLFRELSFPDGVFLMTGTGIVPPASFSLKRGDRILITIPKIGILINEVG